MEKEKSIGMFSRIVSSQLFPEPKASVELVFLERSQTHVHCYCVDLHVCQHASEQLISHICSCSAVVIEIYTAALRHKYISVC